MGIIKCKGKKCEGCFIGSYEICQLEKLDINRSPKYKLSNESKFNFIFAFSKTYIENYLYKHLEDVLLYSSEFIH